MIDADVLLYTDKNGIIHAMQPVRALGRERGERLLHLHRIVHDYAATADRTAIDQAKAGEALTALIELLIILLPTVNPDELIALDHTAKVKLVADWRKVQPTLTYATPSAA